ncbi:hypothetical protein A5658_03390 [Mycobacterium sp. 1245111.1]|uniref:hypothetical protein n=1 Tax=Mycobacterium sp. 1245111.1 TaxID=1834073 RepID=UPI0007FF9444|nr:hypothetical protein [Mycobacterium sp. 1245111.1]OBK38577.1 hypothetical protein A5658_03390 [Mycobacterium sp. 1245111.1]
MSFTGDVHTQIGGWHISARRAFFDEAGHAYAFCTELASGRKEWLEAIGSGAALRVPHLADTDLPQDVTNAALGLLASITGATPRVAEIAAGADRIAG